MSIRDDLMQKVETLELRNARIIEQKTRLKKALNRALQKWRNADDNWNTDKDNEWERFQDIINKC